MVERPACRGRPSGPADDRDIVFSAGRSGEVLVLFNRAIGSVCLPVRIAVFRLRKRSEGVGRQGGDQLMATDRQRTTPRA
jgi:hypothetical protein